MVKAESALVVFDDVSKTYDGKVKVVENLNLEIARGEFLTLLGPSGSGKTTTLMMLAGFEVPSAGRILFDGTPLVDVPTYKRNFGMVFQNYALFPHMTVEANLAFPLRMHKFPRAEIAERVRQTLDIVKLGHLADRKPQQLSGGQQQRVALARALVFNPRMVLMDEPLGALDKQLREHMQIEIKKIHDDLGITMLYVTHDQTEALTMSDRIAVFNEGRIQHIGPPTEVYDRPQNAFVASFMGENNTFHGEVLERNGDEVTVRCDSGGAVVRAIANEPLQRGDRVQVMARPERMHIDRQLAVENGFQATVEGVIFHGDHLRLSLRVEALGPIVSKLPFEESRQSYSAGDSVTVGWAAAGMLAFRAEA
ncbi:ABC transporter ATP-binding protein [Limibacillus sp. MBR-115]|jgi:putative spermidine/putrescine transport system ATP-binding protein|uniref:ABC transporter ATP-binding protein n=1 Tax=Limibacillus sp. MBR-115 TaxID=3156465 RepID=UPI003398A39F